MKKALYTFIALLTLSIATQAQNVGINTDGSDPADSVLLEVRTTNGATLPTSMVSVVNDNNGATNRTGFQLYNSVTGANSLWNLYNPGGASTDFRINNAGNDYMTILNSGHVGIGTATPIADLHIEGSGTAAERALVVKGGSKFVQIVPNLADFNWNTLSLNGDMGMFFSTDGDNSTDANNGLLIAPWSLSANGLKIMENGNVGIGTATPTAQLDVDGSAIFNESGAAVDFRVEGDTEANLLFVDGSADRVGIGTTNPSNKLDVRGGGINVRGGGINIDTDGDGDGCGIFEFSEGLALSAYTGTAAPLIILSDNNLAVGFGNTTPNAMVDVTGNIEYTGTITDVSDRRLKENFSSIDSVLTKIMKIEGLSYNMIADTNKTREYGVIAQDVQPVFPEMVTVVDPENGYLGVSYIQLVPVLLEATKEQQAIIEAQKKEIAELKAKASNTTQRFEEIEAKLNLLLNQNVVTAEE
jgi:hypothetical protein